MAYDIADFGTLMGLEPHGPDTYLAVGPDYPWGRVYGGQVVAQGLRSAAATVDASFRAHSLHAYFIRPGDAREPIRFEVDRLRDGRSFVTRQVVARQSGGAILNLSCSFQVDESGAEVQATGLPDVPGPEESGTSTSWGTLLDRRPAGPVHPGLARTWLRVVGPLDEDPVLHRCALAYASDDVPMEAAIAHHPDWTGTEADHLRFRTASLDHAIWFHRAVRGDDWHLYDQRCDGLRGGRGTSLGRVFSADGLHVATVAQEVLIRRARQ
jgi:acyl-CoA thioesterase II